MAADGGFGFEFDFDFDQGGGIPPRGGSFSRLLLSDDVVLPFSFPVSPSPPPSSSCASLFSMDTPKMLCFGDFSEEDELGSSQITSQSVPSSPVSKSSSNASISSLSNPSTCNKKRNGTPPPEKEASGDLSGAGAPKKSRSGPGHAKVKKREKLGDRIATLQQLVSPYGKTDTASVLHETMGYIRFLQDQVKVLCSPYLQGLPSSSSLLTSHGKIYKYQNSTQDLKSKGLCLIPVSSIADVASRNGADLWSPVTIKAIATRNAAASVTATTASLIC